MGLWRNHLPLPKLDVRPSSAAASLLLLCCIYLLIFIIKKGIFCMSLERPAGYQITRSDSIGSRLADLHLGDDDSALVRPTPFFPRLHHLQVEVVPPHRQQHRSDDDLHACALEALSVEVNKKISDLTAALLRLEDSASPKLREHMERFQNLARTFHDQSALMEDRQSKISYIRLRLAVIAAEVEEELLHCVERYSDGCLNTMEPALLRQVFNISSPVKEMMVFRAIQELVAGLLLNGRTERRIIDTGFGKECQLKSRYRVGRVQILTKEFLGRGRVKDVKKVTILAGSVGLLGSVYAYAKPRKDSGQYSHDECLAFLCHEVETSRHLRKMGVRNIVDLVPVFRQKSVVRTVKGLAMELFDHFNIASLIKSSQYPIDRMEMANRLELALRMAVALAGCHKNGVLHGNFKPENVLTKQTDEGMTVCLCDFGCAVPIGTPSSEHNGSPFLAPEQWLVEVKGKWLAAAGTDMWSFGLFLLSLIYGERENLINRQVTKEFMSLPPHRQYQDMCRFQRAQVARLSAGDAVGRLIADLLRLDPSERPSASQTAARLEEGIREFQ